MFTKISGPTVGIHGGMEATLACPSSWSSCTLLINVLFCYSIVPGSLPTVFDSKFDPLSRM